MVPSSLTSLPHALVRRVLRLMDPSWLTVDHRQSRGALPPQSSSAEWNEGDTERTRSKRLTAFQTFTELISISISSGIRLGLVFFTLDYRLEWILCHLIIIFYLMLVCLAGKKSRRKETDQHTTSLITFHLLRSFLHTISPRRKRQTKGWWKRREERHHILFLSTECSEVVQLL